MGSERAAIRLGSKSHDNRLGAGTRRCAGGRPTGENFPPNRCLRHSGRTKGPVDHHVAQMWQQREAVCRGVRRTVERPLEGRDKVLHHALKCRRNKGSRHPVRTGGYPYGLRRHADAVRVRGMHEAIDVEQRDSFAIHRHLDLLTTGESAGKCSGGLVKEVERKGVRAIGGKGVDHRRAAARSEGRSLDMLHLRSRFGNAVSRRDRASRGVAHRQPTDFARRSQVAVQ